MTCFVRKTRVVASCAALLVLMAGCSDSVETDPLEGIDTRPATTEPWSEFCGTAVALVDYLDDNAAALFDPSTAGGFLAGAEERLGELEGTAPQEIAPEVIALRGAYREVDRLLGEVGYDVALIDSELLLAQIDTEASLAFDDYLVSDCGFRAGSAGAGPEILSEEELALLLGEQPDPGEVAEVDRMLTTLLSEVSGWSDVQIECVISELSMPSKDELVNGGLAGGPVSAEATEEFARSRVACGIEEAGS